jgi:hypothetical protein
MSSTSCAERRWRGRFLAEITGFLAAFMGVAANANSECD